MSDFFDQFERSMTTALEAGANVPWYQRGWRPRHGRALTVIFGALMLGAPAGVVSDCFGACPRPGRTPVAQSAPRPAPTQPMTPTQRGITLGVEYRLDTDTPRPRQR